MYKVFGLGHRFLENENQVRENIRASLDYFISIHGQIECISNLACGADTIFIQEAINKKCKIQLILPFQINEYEKDFDSESLILFRSIIANHAYIVHGDLKSSDDIERDLAYQSVGRSKIEECDAILAVWDGEIGKGLGGTKDHVDYAILKEKDLHWIKAKRVSNEDVLIDSTSIEYNQFYELDQSAIKFKAKYQQIWKLGLISGIFAVLCFSINLNFISIATVEEKEPFIKFLISIIELIFIGVSFYLLGFQAMKFKSKFLIIRKKAEELRAELWEREIGYLNILSTLRLNKTRESILINMNLKRLMWGYSNDQIIYQNKRITKFKANLHSIHIILNVLKYCFLLNLILISSLECYHWLHESSHSSATICSGDNILNILIFLWILIPPIFATLEGVIHYNDWKKNIQTSLELVHRYEKVKVELLSSNDSISLKNIINELFNTFTLEVNTWLTEQKNNEIKSKI